MFVYLYEAARSLYTSAHSQYAPADRCTTHDTLAKPPTTIRAFKGLSLSRVAAAARVVEAIMRGRAITRPAKSETRKQTIQNIPHNEPVVRALRARSIAAKPGRAHRFARLKAEDAWIIFGFNVAC